MTSRASENIRETEVTAPVTKAKPESPKEQEDTGRKSIAQLAALINVNAIGGMGRPGGKLPPALAKKQQPVA